MLLCAKHQHESAIGKEPLDAGERGEWKNKEAISISF